jgi:DNA excision repair protein ERCC-4
MALVFCPACDKIKEYTIVSYEKPLSSLADIWLSDIPRRTKTVCHKCKNPVYFTMPSESVKCPRCKRGTFEVFEPFEEDCSRFPVLPPQTPLRVRQDGRTIRIPRPTVVVDSQEHRGYKFERFTNWFAGTIHRRLPIGDYTLLDMEDEVAVERKTLPDLVRSIIQERKDFIKKCEGLSVFKKKCVVIEGSLGSIKTPYEDSQAHPNAVLGSLLAAQERWEIPVYFLDDFSLAEEFVASMLSKYHAYQWLEINGFKRCLIEGDI